MAKQPGFTRKLEWQYEDKWNAMGNSQFDSIGNSN